MKSSTTPSFWKAYAELPSQIQASADKAYDLWRRDPRHKSLRFEKKGEYWAVRVTRGWRARAREHKRVLYWFWIGPHDEYERLIRG